MKIFAKRRKKDAGRNTKPESQTTRSSFASDPVVEELLKKDPSEWNAKQKRMVKRYQQRKAEIGERSEEQQIENPVNKAGSSEDMAVENNQEEEENKSEDKVVSKKDESDSSDSDSDSDSGSGSDSSSDEEVDSERDEKDHTEKETETRKEEPAESSNAELETPSDPATEAETDSGMVGKSHPVYKLLDQLNSKTKRTLSRKLDREGAKVLPEVEEEAKKILGITAEPSKKRGADAVEDKQEGGTGKSKKKKKKVDWSTLPPEERLRREEQRRKQQEAAERRASGEMTGGHHKHPLNSERRRANRRKPKWKNSFKVEEKKNHNASGFLARRDTAARRKHGY